MSYRQQTETQRERAIEREGSRRKEMYGEGRIKARGRKENGRGKEGERWGRRGRDRGWKERGKGKEGEKQGEEGGDLN